MPIQREFHDWGTPALIGAAEYLVRRYRRGDVVDLDRVVVVVPGARAGRRLREVLVERASDDGPGFFPPQIVTVGHLPELLYEPQRPFADDLTQQLAWTRAIQDTDPAVVRLVLPDAQAATDDQERRWSFSRWMEYGRLLWRQHRELAADRLDFSDVARLGSEIDGFDEKERWEALAQIQRRYLALLDKLQLWDRQTARLVAIERHECHSENEIVLLGTADMNRTMRQMLDQVADRVTALVHAPRAWADRFDEHGCLDPKQWQDVRIDVEPEQVSVVDGPAEQAEAALRAIAGFDGKFRADEITVGVPDELLVPYLQRRFAQSQLTARWGPGEPISRSRPYRLLEAVASYVRHRRFADLATLVRHPDVYQWLRGQPLGDNWLTEVDKYYELHLPSRLTDKWFGNSKHAAVVRQIHKRLEDWIGPVAGGERPLNEWSEPVIELLLAIYGDSQFDQQDAAQRSTVVACASIHEALVAQAELPAELVPRADVTTAIGLALEQAGTGTIPQPTDPEAIELLGWLELPLDDAPALLVTALNDGLVPAAVNSDLFLPNALRSRLGLDDNQRRYARDAYALSVLLASREQVRLIVGRRDTEGNSLRPSRLLFAADAETIARRALKFFAVTTDGGGPSAGAPEGQLGSDPSSFHPPLPQPLPEPITVMRPTDFRAYLACPYRFYLERVLDLAPVRDDAEELDAAAFGTLLHEVLRQFGAGPARDSTDAEEIAGVLNQAVDQVVAKTYGRNVLAAVQVQIEQLRTRLNAFAERQAERAREGWRIEHTELSSADKGSALIVDGKPMYLNGRIDRVDLHRESGQRIIFDYKSSDTAKKPEQAHRKKSGEWVDLQLPLYRHMATAFDIRDDVRVGYICLPKDSTENTFRIAEWSESDFDDAMKTADDVVRAIRREEFWPPVQPPPDFSEPLSAICMDRVMDKPKYAKDLL